MSPCPSDAELAALLDGELSDAQRERLEVHCLECSTCHDVLDLIRTRAEARDGDPHVEGLKVGRYELLEQLGQGAMGIVYAAHDPKLDRRIALKLLNQPSSEIEETWRSRWLREARAMAAISHPHVLTVHDAGEFGDRVFIAMELVNGPTLRQWLQETRSVTEILRCLGDAGRGLAAAHGRGLVHRDFKPDNVLIDDDGRVLVSDFGLARFGTDEAVDAPQAPGADTLDEASSDLTRTGALVGTPAYMAPEQLEGRVADAKSDQFSFCVALYEALYRTRPFEGRTIAGLAAAISEGRVEKGEPRGRVSPSVRSAILRGLSESPDDRFESMDALLRRLPHARGGRWLVPAAVGIGLGAIAVWAAGGQTSTVDCEDASRALADVFAPDAVKRHLSGDDDPETWQRLEASLHGYADQWATVRRQACAAEQSVEVTKDVREARNTCLYRAGLRYRMLLSEVRREPAPPMLSALRAATSLPSPQQCIDAAGEADATSSSTTLEELLSQASAAQSLSDEARAVELAEKALAMAEAGDDRRAQARALRMLAMSFKEGETAKAELRLKQAIKLSTELGDHRFASSCWNDLARMLIHGRRDLQAAAFALDMSDAEAGQTDDRPADELDRLRYRIEYAAVAGELDEGRAHLERAREILAEHDISDEHRLHFRMSEAQFCLATGEYEPMIEALMEIRNGWAARLGPGAPDVRHYGINVGLGLIRVERWADAQAELEPLLAHEDDPVNRAVILWSLGDARAGREDLEGALVRFDESLAVLSALDSPPAHRMLELRLRRFDTLLRLGRLDDSERELEHAQAVREAAQSPVLASNIEMNYERLKEAREAEEP